MSGLLDTEGEHDEEAIRQTATMLSRQWPHGGGTPMTNCTEALRLLKEWMDTLIVLDNQPKRTELMELKMQTHLLLADSEPACDAEKAVLVARLREFSLTLAEEVTHGTLKLGFGPDWPAKKVQLAIDRLLLANTSPAAAALLAQRERHRKALELILRAPGQAKSIARAALSGEEKE